MWATTRHSVHNNHVINAPVSSTTNLHFNSHYPGEARHVINAPVSSTTNLHFNNHYPREARHVINAPVSSTTNLHFNNHYPREARHVINATVSSTTNLHFNNHYPREASHASPLSTYSLIEHLVRGTGFLQTRRLFCQPTDSVKALNSSGWMVGWEINVPFLHKNRLYRGQGLGWRSSSARFRQWYSNLPTSLPFCSATTQNGKQ